MTGGERAAEPFRLVIRMVVAAADQAEFEEAWLKMAASAETHPANLGQWLCRDLDDPEVWVITSDWIDRPSYREFVAGPGHAEHAGALQRLRRSQTITTMSIRHHLVGPAQAPGSPVEGVQST